MNDYMLSIKIAREFEVTTWFARSGNIGRVDSAIVNIRLWSDRRRVKKVHIYFDYKINAYVTEAA